MGKFFGLKLHLVVNEAMEIMGWEITEDETHDKQPVSRTLPADSKILVGDSHYGGKKLRRKLFNLFKCRVIAPQMTTKKGAIVEQGYYQIYKVRPRVEIVFSVLKQKFHFR